MDRILEPRGQNRVSTLISHRLRDDQPVRFTFSSSVKATVLRRKGCGLFEFVEDSAMPTTMMNRDAAERRRRPRLRLAYPVRLFRVNTESRIETTTEDISCEGFFCITESTFSPRESLDCELVIAGDDNGAIDEAIVLRCRAEVVRVVPQAENSSVGVGCRVTSYTLDRKLIDQDFIVG